MDKKSLVFTIVLSFICLSFVGCQLQKPTLLGTWCGTKYVYYQDGKEIGKIEFPHWADSDCSYLPYIQFNEERASFYSKVTTEKNSMIYLEEAFSYVVSGNKMMMVRKDKSNVNNYTFAVTDDTFIITIETLVGEPESSKGVMMKTEMKYVRRDDSELAHITIKPGSLGFR